MAERISLADLKNGEEGTVVEIFGGLGIQSRLRSMGIKPGIKIKKISGVFSHGPVVVQAGNSQTALGFGICYKIIVETDI